LAGFTAFHGIHLQRESQSLNQCNRAPLAGAGVLAGCNELPINQLHLSPPSMPLTAGQPPLLAHGLLRHQSHDCCLICAASLLCLHVPPYTSDNLPLSYICPRHLHRSLAPHTCSLLPRVSTAPCKPVFVHGIFRFSPCCACIVDQLGPSHLPRCTCSGAVDGCSICHRGYNLCEQSAREMVAGSI
jgi:hypothetical protein